MRSKRRLLSLCLSLVMMLTVFLPACGSSGPAIDPENVWSALLYDIGYAEELKGTKRPLLYFNDLPEGAEVRYFNAGSGYYADEAIMITLKSEDEIEQAKESVQAHFAEYRDQFSKYIPEEVPKYDHAVFRDLDNRLFVSVTGDYLNAAKVLDSALTDPNYKPKFIYSDTAATAPATVAETDPEETETNSQTAAEDALKEELALLRQELYGKRTDVVLNDNGYPKLASPTGNVKFYSTGGVYRVDDAAFEPFYYGKGDVETVYAEAVNRAAAALKGSCRVYDLLIPTSSGVTVPDNAVPNVAGYQDQGEAIKKIYAQISDDVVKIDLYTVLMNHRDEYIYFRTDTHWSQLGAYYAYSAFCLEKGIRRIPISERKTATFEPFRGYFYQSSSGKDPALRADAVNVYYYVSENATMKYTSRDGTETVWPIIADGNGEYYTENRKYLIFAGTDNPYTVFQNPDITDGSACIIVKESFGNCLVPFFVDHYQTVYEIDYRYWTGDLAQFAKDVNASDLIFANNMSMVRTGSLVGSLDGIVK